VCLYKILIRFSLILVSVSQRKLLSQLTSLLQETAKRSTIYRLRKSAQTTTL
jgi:hypothetical protein